MTVTEALLQIAELTKKNLQILEVLNDSFYTKSSHISTTVGDTTFTIPSYIALENKVNHLQDAFNNLVHAAKSGEAWFNFDGNSKEILVRGYQQAPNPINLPTTNNFASESKFMFKDMLTPQPYLDFDMSALPDDVTQVVVKKYIPYNEKLLQNLEARCTGIGDGKEDATQNLSWAELMLMAKSIQPDLEPENDYLEYDTIYDLPIRKNTKSGTYVIESVIEDLITQNLENQITVKIRPETPLKCTNFDGIGTTDLRAGDILVSYDGSAKLKILDINESARKLKLLVMSGEYVNPIPSEGIDINSVSDYSKLRLYSVVDDSRRLHIPLEEDQYVYIAVAPLNSRLNIQTEWGMGIFVNTNNLKMNGMGFRDYYNANVTNMGDAIVELSNILYPSVTKYSSDQMNKMLDVPNTKYVYTQVVQINRHLNDSEAVKNIRALYSQKKQYQTDLQECQDKIAALTSELAQISFDDMSGTRSAYTAQITDLKDQQNNLVTSINKIIDNIATSANNAEIPIEAGKFRVRGYLDVDKIINGLTGSLGTTADAIRKNVLGIECRYRYKNPDIPQANVSVINEFLFTEWATYRPPFRERTMSYSDGRYKIEAHDITNNKFDLTTNVPKFNQIDIPITQGEIVEFQVRLIWGFGYPFVTTASKWSELIEVTFPPELVKDVQVTTIIEENNSDIETNRFETILQTKGVTSHIDDKHEDQDITYFHKPESISSGFYTAERRVIPLKDKLQTLTNDLLNVQDILMGTTAEALKVQFVVDSIASILQPDINNVIQLPAWSSVKSLEDEIPTGQVYKKNGVVYAIGNIMITNITSHNVNIFSMFPGSRDKNISSLKHSVWGEGGPNDKGYFETGEIVVPNVKISGDIIGAQSFPQTANQVISFRGQNPYDGGDLGRKVKKDGELVTVNNGFELPYVDLHTGKKTLDGQTYSSNDSVMENKDEYGLHVWPMSTVKHGLCLNTDAVSAKLELAPAESYSIPIIIEYKLKSDGSETNPNQSFTLGLNIRNSLYKDPLYYQIELIAKYNQSINDALSSAKQNIDTLSSYNTTVR